jgi:hypothetical protein
VFCEQSDKVRSKHHKEESKVIDFYTSFCYFSFSLFCFVGQFNAHILFGTFSLADPMESMDSDEFFHFVARYKFTLSFENAVCDDYITEKLWRPLMVGSVPIYMGSPSVTVCVICSLP